MPRASEVTWVVEAHRVAIDRFATVIAAFDGSRWERPWADGKWTPAEITEHLLLYYEAVLVELGGGGGIRQRVGQGRARLFRWFVLPHILFHRRIPVRVKAPREVRPIGRELTPAAAALALRDVASRFEAEAVAAAADRKRSINHPYFGRMEPLRFVHLSAVHVEHHLRQVEATPSSP